VVGDDVNDDAEVVGGEGGDQAPPLGVAAKLFADSAGIDHVIAVAAAWNGFEYG
jgi:hypothetical protein